MDQVQGTKATEGDGPDVEVRNPIWRGPGVLKSDDAFQGTWLLEQVRRLGAAQQLALAHVFSPAYKAPTILGSILNDEIILEIDAVPGGNISEVRKVFAQPRGRAAVAHGAVQLKRARAAGAVG